MTTSDAPVSEPTAEPVPRRVVRAWSVWDFGQQAFNTVILSFVFSVYVSKGVAADPDNGAAVISFWQFWGGLALALLAPALGILADRSGKTRPLLVATTLLTVAAMASMWFVKPEDSYLALGAILLAVASTMSELASSFYNGLLLRITTPATFGRVSGTAWGLGYIGGVLALVAALFGFVLDGGMLGLPTDGAANLRGVALMCALWFLIFGMPLLLLAPRGANPPAAERVGFFGAYVELGRSVTAMWRSDRVRLHFFIASAIFRDGLSAIFTVAGVLAAVAYGFADEEVIYFGLAANLVAGISTWLSGKLDDRLGPKPVITGSLVIILVLGVIIVISPAAPVFWVCGLAIAGCVGPIQSASRTMLARMSTAERAQEDFGLYATTGRALGFFGLGAFSFFVTQTGTTRLGTIGILLVLLFGLGLFLSLRFTERWQAARVSSTPPSPPVG